MPLWIKAQPHLFGQMVENLLDNASKYSRPGTPIVVRAAREGMSALLSVEDSGCGIAREDLPRIFEPFFRSSRTSHEQISGVGLGLSVVATDRPCLGRESRRPERGRSGEPFRGDHAADHSSRSRRDAVRIRGGDDRQTPRSPLRPSVSHRTVAVCRAPLSSARAFFLVPRPGLILTIIASGTSRIRGAFTIAVPRRTARRFRCARELADGEGRTTPGEEIL